MRVDDVMVLATRSADKVREIRDLFRQCGRRLVTLDELRIGDLPGEEFVESGNTFEENAVAKAQFFETQLRRVVIADDSGLEVVALAGRPGVLSKRWSGRSDLRGKALDEANNARLVAELGGTEERRARYVCVAALVANGEVLTARGTTSGSIIDSPRGSNGFGYDAYFFSDELGKTFGEATLEEKQAVSHRARAFRALLRALALHG